METNDTHNAAFSLVSESESNVFSELVELSGLSPQTDFQHSRLSGVDFAGSNLSAFNFDYADLRGAKWKNRSSDPNSLRYSLRGNGTDEVRGTDFEDLSAMVLSKSTWTERFYAFRLLIDNWGENPETVEVLSQLLRMKSGTYLPLCSFIYFTASYLNDDAAKTWCINMANAGRSQLNMFRLKKLRQNAIQNAKYFDRAALKPRYPKDMTKKDIEPLLRDLSDVMQSLYPAETSNSWLD